MLAIVVKTLWQIGSIMQHITFQRKEEKFCSFEFSCEIVKKLLGLLDSSVECNLLVGTWNMK